MTFGAGGVNPPIYRGQGTPASSDKLDFKQVLFLQLERIDEAMSKAHDPPVPGSMRRFNDAVMALEDRLAPWDTEYIKVQEAAEKIKDKNNPSFTRKQEAFLNAVRKQNQGLQALMPRMGLMPPKTNKITPETPWIKKQDTKA